MKTLKRIHFKNKHELSSVVRLLTTDLVIEIASEEGVVFAERSTCLKIRF